MYDAENVEFKFNWFQFLVVAEPQNLQNNVVVNRGSVWYSNLVWDFVGLFWTLEA